MLVDSHAHLESIDDLDSALEGAKEEGVGKIVTVGTSLAASKKSIEIAQKYSSQAISIYATCGIHPKDGKEEIGAIGSINEVVRQLREIAKSSDFVVGVGETGLDYRLTTNNKQLTTDKEKNFQRELFQSQIELAHEFKLPLVVHCRNGWGEIFDLITNFQTPNSNLKGVFHSWTGNWQAAKKALNLGFYISFSGIVTYKNAPEIQEVAKKMPLEQMLVETDSPFLTPEPLKSAYLRSEKGTPTQLVLRGAQMRNEPKNVRIVADSLATLRNLSPDKIAEATTRNAQELFCL